jgi:hypothetical protein
MDSTRSLWRERGQPIASGLAAVSPRLLHMIFEFERALRGTPAAAAVTLQSRIRAVRDAHDLWHLRDDVYTLVKQTYDKWEARLRIAELDELFDPLYRRASPSTR